MKHFNYLAISIVIITNSLSFAQESLDSVFGDLDKAKKASSSNAKTSYAQRIKKFDGGSKEFYNEREHEVRISAIRKVIASERGDDKPLEIKSNKVSIGNFFQSGGPVELSEQVMKELVAGYHVQGNEGVFYTIQGKVKGHGTQRPFAPGIVTGTGNPYYQTAMEPFMRYVIDGRRSIARKFFAAQEEKHAWLKDIAGKYYFDGEPSSTSDYVEIKTSDGTCLIQSMTEKRSAYETKISRRQVLGFGGVSSNHKINVIEFRTSNKVPQFMWQVIDVLSQPVLRNGWTHPELKEMVFSEDFLALEIDGVRYVNKERQALIAKQQQEEEKAERAIELRQRVEHNRQKFAELKKAAPELIERCKKEAAKKGEFCIKGLSLGMASADAAAIFGYYDDRIVTPKKPKDEELFVVHWTGVITSSGPCEDIVLDASGKIKCIYLPWELVDKLFNSSSATAAQFAQAFVNHYGTFVPTLEVDKDCWYYRDLKQGFEVRLWRTKAITLTRITKSSEFNFD
ncbi:hypothetical protein P4B35_23415 [Pontiellaceae bacterium B12227]|nr:hypothetical protein [Pontiellaceae bacterium B12227]